MKDIDDHQYKAKYCQQRCLFISSNVLYALLLIGSMICVQFEEKDGIKHVAWGVLDMVCKILPVILLVIFIVILSSLIRLIGGGILMTRKKLMTIHTVIFSVYIAAIIGVKGSDLAMTHSYNFVDQKDWT